MLRRLYDTTLRLAAHRHALWYLAAVSFAESSVFPITPLVMLAPMVLARPERAWLIALVCTAASVAGGVLGWWIGHALYEQIGAPVLALYGKAEAFDDLAATFREVGTEAVLIAAISPVPYKAVTIASGAAGLSLPVLIGASIVGRAIQFFGVTAVLWYFGPAAKRLIEAHMALVSTILAILLIGGFVLVKYVV